jgi:D-alanyl-D-alanine carboxypeptidase
MHQARTQIRTRTLHPLKSLSLVAGALLALTVAQATPASAEAFLVIEADSGKVLQAENATYPWYPASVTKVMTAYVILKAVKDGRIRLDSPFVVSPNALAQSPTKMGFKVGTVVTADNALKMLMVKSANDMAVLLAEGLSGSVEGFADEMNAQAARLGMTQTHYVNPNGLPADDQVSSARDQAILARAIYRELPEYDLYWRLPGIKFGKRIIRNYNRLIDLYPGADGMKTGFICASGFNLVASATRNNRRLIAVVFGSPSSAVRAYKAAKLLEQGFTSNKGINWLMPSLGTVEQLKPIEATPPNLREEMCGPKRKRPAAEDEEVVISANTATEAGDQQSPLAFMLSNLQKPITASQALAGGVAALPPVEVFVGAFKPNSVAALEAQESVIAGKKVKAKGQKKSKTAAATPAKDGAKSDKPATDAKTKPAAAKSDAAKPAAKPATPAAAKPAPAAKPAAAKPAQTAARPQSSTAKQQ